MLLELAKTVSYVGGLSRDAPSSCSLWYGLYWFDKSLYPLLYLRLYSTCWTLTLLKGATPFRCATLVIAVNIVFFRLFKAL